MRLLAFAFAALLALVSTAAPARAVARLVLVLNQGNSAIFHLRVGSAADAKWSPDLLGFDGVIDVGRGQEVSVDIDESACTVDLQAVYADGTSQIAPAVDLCTTDRVSFYQGLPTR